MLPTNHIEFSETRNKLKRASRLHGVHWLVICLSLLLTFAAWYITKNQVDEKVASQFNREANQVVALVAERMRRYEDALWGGVGAHAAHPGDIDRAQWREFANTLNLAHKYPGINGIGVIHRIPGEQLTEYLARERQSKPHYKIHPQHDGAEKWPISYVEPEDANRKAIGLDMAHESNRYSAAKKARDTGLAQITGPIVLVQDSEKTPGFLFYAPFYRPFANPTPSLDERRKAFIGLVYAPFIAGKLMLGVLDKTNRHVAFGIKDGDSVLYDELHSGEADFDAQPLFKQRSTLQLYGRSWQFDIWSTKSFREIIDTDQPSYILVGGLTIDALLFGLFLFLTRANRHALIYAELATRQLRHRTRRLERSNADLEQFAYIASHDLREPLRMIGNFSQLLRREFREHGTEQTEAFFNFVASGVDRMQLLLDDLLTYARVGADNKPQLNIDTRQVVADAVDNLRAAIDESGAEIDIGPLPVVHGDESQLTRLFQNLISNALKFTAPERPPSVVIRAEEQSDHWLFSVADNGIGIDERYFDKIFMMFQRLNDRESYSGTGVGLAICKKLVLAHDGTLWLESKVGVGTTFFFTLRKEAASLTTGSDVEHRAAA